MSYNAAGTSLHWSDWHFVSQSSWLLCIPGSKFTERHIQTRPQSSISQKSSDTENRERYTADHFRLVGCCKAYQLYWRLAHGVSSSFSFTVVVVCKIALLLNLECWGTLRICFFTAGMLPVLACLCRQKHSWFGIRPVKVAVLHECLHGLSCMSAMA